MEQKSFCSSLVRRTSIVVVELSILCGLTACISFTSATFSSPFDPILVVYTAGRLAANYLGWSEVRDHVLRGCPHFQLHSVEGGTRAIRTLTVD